MYQCNICRKSFQIKESFERHFMINGRKSLCKIRGELYSLLPRDENVLARWKRSAERKVPCEKCGQFFEMISMKAHLSYCEEKFRQLELIHQVLPKKSAGIQEKLVPKNPTKTPGKTVSCEECGKLISTKSMARHLRIHNGEKPFQCSYCDMKFIQKSDKRKHEFIHIRE